MRSIVSKSFAVAVAVASVAACAAPTSSEVEASTNAVSSPTKYAYVGVSDQGTEMPCKLTLDTSDGQTVTKVSLETYVLDHSFEVGDVTHYQTGAVMPKDVPQEHVGTNDANGPDLEGGDIHQLPFITTSSFPFVARGVTLSTTVTGYNKGSLLERLLTVTQNESLKITGSVDAVSSFTYSASIRLVTLLKVDSAEASCHDMQLVTE